MIETKLAAIGLAIAAVSQLADSALQAIMLAGAAAAALLAIATLARRVWRFIVKVDRGVDILHGLPDRLDHADQRLNRVEQRLDLPPLPRRPRRAAPEHP